MDADLIAKRLMTTDKDLKNEIIKLFGEQSYLEDGSLNVNYLREKVFSDINETKKINAAVHPRLKKEVRKMMEEILREKNIVFAEAALLFEAKMEDLFDYIVCVRAPKEERLKRASIKYGISISEAEARDQKQISEEEKAKRSSFTIFNNSDVEELKRKAIFFKNFFNTLANKNEKN